MEALHAGEALVETVKTGDRRLIGYAVDYGTRVTTAFDTGTETIREIHARNGVMSVRIASLAHEDLHHQKRRQQGQDPRR